MAQFVGPEWYNRLTSKRGPRLSQCQAVGATLHQALTGIARLTASAGASYESAEHGIAASFGRP